MVLLNVSIFKESLFFSFVKFTRSMEAFFTGIILGLTLAISIGPGFVALFQTSIVRGIYAGAIFATGMLLSDLTLVSISYFGLSAIILNGNYRILGMISGLLLIIMGGVAFFKSPSLDFDSTKGPVLTKNLKFILVKGYFLNILNPFSLIFWIGLVSFAGKNWGIHNYNIVLFLGGVFFTAFSTDLLKCYFSGLLRKVLVSNVIHRINIIMGIIFIGIGFFIIYKVH